MFHTPFINFGALNVNGRFPSHKFNTTQLFVKFSMFEADLDKKNGCKEVLFLEAIIFHIWLHYCI